MIDFIKRMLTLQLLFAAVVFFLPFETAADPEEENSPTLKLEKENLSEDGHIKIEWDMTVAHAEVELQQAKREDFSDATIIYHGPDNATFISGLEDGTYYYRIRKVDGTWSDFIRVKVKHHSLSLAISLFAAGSIVFLLTVWVVVNGALTATTE
jgi:hypothetical protein